MSKYELDDELVAEYLRHTWADGSVMDALSDALEHPRKGLPERAFAPHCDPSVLHAPGECRFCDEYPSWQEYRAVARINFTGHETEGVAPCPSEFSRSGETRDRWPGNVAVGHDEDQASYFEAAVEHLPEGFVEPPAGSAPPRGGMVSPPQIFEVSDFFSASQPDPGPDGPGLVPPVYPWHVRAWARIRYWLGL